MVKPNEEFDRMIDPVDLEEPEEPKSGTESPESIWMRGLMMVILALMFALAETILGVVAVVQFLWMLFNKEKNALLMDFGRDIGNWLRDVALFQAGTTDEKPFPWAKWGA
ncbi:MAG: DUF4389 domain-containing protein [Paracoccaceae bacterium]